MTSRPETEQLREVFTNAAYDINPSPVPLAAIERAGRRTRRGHIATLAITCVLLVVPLTATLTHLSTSGPARLNTPASGPMVQPAATNGSARVVASGERVQAAPGVQLWLTKEGKHWSTPGQASQFRSVVDGNIDRRRPGVSLQAELVDGRYFLSGVFNGKGDAASVKVVTDRGTVVGTVVRLAGQPGWGAWYATSKLPIESKSKDFRHNFVRSVTVSDAAGRTITALTLP